MWRIGTFTNIVAWDGARWMVNGATELVFYHFSGISVDGGNQISKHLNRLDLTQRHEMVDLFEQYRQNVVCHGFRELVRKPYAFGTFSNGMRINKLARSIYAANLKAFVGENPFDASGLFYSQASSAGLLSKKDSSGKYNRTTYNKCGWRVRLVHRLLRLALRVLGADSYTILMKYFAFISRLRNQPELLPDSAASRVASRGNTRTSQHGKF